MTTSSKIDGNAAPVLPDDALVALIAGGGSLPAEIAARLVENGHRLVLFPIWGEVEDESRYQAYTTEPIAMEEFGSLVTRLKRSGATHVMMAGTVKRRPKIANMRPGLGLIKALLDVAKALTRGDDGLLRAVIGHIEKSGFRVISAQDVLPELLIEEGAVTTAKPTKRDMADISAAKAAAKAIGALDIGQAAVSIGGRAVALEGIEGTGGLLERTASLRAHGRLAGARGGVLVKCAKPGQELRADLPAIGPDTIVAAAKAGLSGVAVEAGRSLLLERDKTLYRARELGVFVYGIRAEDP